MNGHLPRRSLLQLGVTVAAGSTLAAAPWAHASPHTPGAPLASGDTPWVLQVGLDTDAGFARGAAGHASHHFRVDASGYGTLVAALTASRGAQVLALLDPAHALLVEQAVRDSGARLSGRWQLQAPSVPLRAAWAQQLGHQLSQAPEVPADATATTHLPDDTSPLTFLAGEARIALLVRP